MQDQDKSKQQLIAENEELRRRIVALESVDGDRGRAEESLRKLNDELEQKVKERTADFTIFQRFAEASGRGFGMADLQGYFTYVNPTLCRLFGEEKPEDVVGNHVTTYCPEEFRRRWADEILPALLRDEMWQEEVTLVSRSGARIPTLPNGFLVRDENGAPFRLAVAVPDISELKRVEEALRASTERFDLAIRGAGVGIWDYDVLAGTVFYSPRWKAMFGYREDEIGDGLEDWARLLHPEEHDRIIKLQEDFLAGTETHITTEYRLRHKDGSYRWIEAQGIVVRNGGGKAIRLVGSHGDITARKKAEDALSQERQALWRMLQASDHERQVISCDIHDGLAQFLGGAAMRFQAYEAMKETFPEKAQIAYETAVEFVRQAHGESRRLISDVRPPVIDERGLETAMSHMLHEQRRQGAPQIEFDSDVQFRRLSPVLENSLYRIAQEAVTNACKYSRSETVKVRLIQEGQEVRLEVQDWGVGFDPDSVVQGHFGLDGIRQRVRLLGGRLALESRPGAGTRVQVVVPILERESETATA